MKIIQAAAHQLRACVSDCLTERRISAAFNELRTAQELGDSLAIAAAAQKWKAARARRRPEKVAQLERDLYISIFGKAPQ